MHHVQDAQREQRKEIFTYWNGHHAFPCVLPGIFLSARARMFRHKAVVQDRFGQYSQGQRNCQEISKTSRIYSGCRGSRA